MSTGPPADLCVQQKLSSALRLFHLLTESCCSPGWRLWADLGPTPLTLAVFPRTWDAFSTFYLGEDGLIHCHKVEKVG